VKKATGNIPNNLLTSIHLTSAVYKQGHSMSSSPAERQTTLLCSNTPRLRLLVLPMPVLRKSVWSNG